MSQAKQKVSELKKLAKKKFRSLRRFCKLANKNYYEVNLFLTNFTNNPTEERANVYNDLYRSIEEMDEEEKLDIEVTEDQIQKVKEGIDKEFGTVGEFIRQNPEYTKYQMSRFLNGKVKTNRNELIKQLITKFSNK